MKYKLCNYIFIHSNPFICISFCFVSLDNKISMLTSFAPSYTLNNVHSLCTQVWLVSVCFFFLLNIFDISGISLIWTVKKAKMIAKFHEKSYINRIWYGTCMIRGGLWPSQKESSAPYRFEIQWNFWPATGLHLHRIHTVLISTLIVCDTNLLSVDKIWIDEVQLWIVCSQGMDWIMQK